MAGLRPVVGVDALVVFQAAFDLVRFPFAFVVQNVGQFVELAVIEFDAPGSSVRDVGLGTEVVEDGAAGGVVARLDGSDG